MQLLDINLRPLYMYLHDCVCVVEQRRDRQNNVATFKYLSAIFCSICCVLRPQQMATTGDVTMFVVVVAGGYLYDVFLLCHPVRAAGARSDAAGLD